MSKKKKNRPKTEREIFIAEQARQRKTEKAALEKRKERNSKIITFLVFIVLLLVSIAMFSLSIAEMYNYETNYEKIDGEITGYIRCHRTGKRTSISYNLEISYNVDGITYKFIDSAVYFEYVDHLIGNTTKIYVSKDNPEKAVKVTTADDLSIISAPLFAVSVVAFVFFAMLCQNLDSTFKKRFTRIWLPIFITCWIFILLCWIGLPNSNFSEIFKFIDGSVGYLVIACISVLVSIFDGFISLRHKNKTTKKWH